MIRCEKTKALLLTLGLTVALPLGAQDVDEAPLGEAVERHLSTDTEFMQWTQDPERFELELGDNRFHRRATAAML